MDFVNRAFSIQWHVAGEKRSHLEFLFRNLGSYSDPTVFGEIVNATCRSSSVWV